VSGRIRGRRGMATGDLEAIPAWGKVVDAKRYDSLSHGRPDALHARSRGGAGHFVRTERRWHELSGIRGSPAGPTFPGLGHRRKLGRSSVAVRGHDVSRERTSTTSAIEWRSQSLGALHGGRSRLFHGSPCSMEATIAGFRLLRKPITMPSIKVCQTIQDRELRRKPVPRRS